MHKNEYFPQTRSHPCETLNEKLDEMNMDWYEFINKTGKKTKKDRDEIHAILNGEGSITNELATIFEDITKIPAHFWMNKQRGYDEFINNNTK